MKWNDFCQPLDNGGLGVRKLQGQNFVFLLKLGYKLVVDTEVLWVKILRKKYDIHGIIPATSVRSNCSYIWRSIANVWESVKASLIWNARNGGLVNF